ncbi:hypothetical protein AQJ54_02390 [Streptomyces griseorubiginosus]|uniref:S1 motif domain-containing protein n=1 Tax=Streptomyces griseorubiginosus TaxID=67304 RepID=A0A101SDK7_9ACTN|nr:hypothetical protein AQJ54_02390 [Streptomyces griseorubiginosus]
MSMSNDEFDVVITLVSTVGVMVEAQGFEGFVDLRKHPSWWDGADSPQIGDRLHVVVLDDSRTPPRLSALQDDIEISRRARGGGP